MPIFSANITMMFQEVPFMDRFCRSSKSWIQSGGVYVSIRVSGRGFAKGAQRE